MEVALSETDPPPKSASLGGNAACFGGSSCFEVRTGFASREARANAGEKLEGAKPGSVVIDVSGDDEFVGLGHVNEFQQCALDSFRRTYCGNQQRHGG